MRTPSLLACLTPAAVAAVLAVASPTALAADKLPSGFKLAAGQTSVSGLSSGAFMAVQLQVAYSADISGAGVVAGGPYYCAAGSSLNTAACMGFLPVLPSFMVKAAQDMAASGSIDPLSQLSQRKVYLYSGTHDTVVLTPAVQAALDFFKGAGVPDANLKFENTVPSGHALITPSNGNACGANASPYVSHCTVNGTGYDQAGAILSHIYGPLQAKSSTPEGRLLAFNQRDFAGYSTSMAAEGYVYIPNTCQAGNTCKVHVALHGCSQSVDSVGMTFVNEAGYNAWADRNQMIVLYPQVNSSWFFPSNPMGCWDWFGYTGQNYAQKSAAQMTAIMSMVKTLGSSAR